MSKESTDDFLKRPESLVADEPLTLLRRRVFANWAMVFSAQTTSAIFGLFSFILMSRTIGVNAVGVVVVVQTYWRVIEGLFSFQSFQSFIKYGTDALASKNFVSFKAIAKVCMLADGAVALFSVGIGWLGLVLFHSAIKVPDYFLPLALWSSATMISMLTGASIGILRVFNKFELTATRDVLAGSTRLLGCLICFFLRLSDRAFLLAWLVSEVFANISLVYFGVREMRSRGFGRFWAIPIRSSGVAVGKLIHSLFVINFSSMIRVTSEEGDTLLVGSLLGPASAAIYKIAKNYSSLIYKFAGPVQQALYPTFAKLIARRNRRAFRRLFIESAVLCAILGLAAVIVWHIFGSWIVILTLRKAYLPAVPLIVVLTLAYTCGLTGIGSTPALLSFGKVKLQLGLSIVCTVAFFLMALVAIPRFGLIGAAYGQLACYSVGLLTSLGTVVRITRKYRWQR